MGVKVDVSTKGLREALSTLENGQRKLRDLRPVLRVTAEKIKSMTDEAFVLSQAPDGTAWAPLKPTTLKSKASHGYSPKPLIRRGARGLQGSTHATAERQSIKVGVSPTAPHGGYHQQGTRKIPRRAFLPFTVGGDLVDTPKMRAVIEDMEKRLRKHLFGE